MKKSKINKDCILLLAVALPDKFKHQRDLWFIDDMTNATKW